MVFFASAIKSSPYLPWTNDFFSNRAGENGSDFGLPTMPTQNCKEHGERESSDTQGVELSCAEAEKDQKLEELLQVSVFCYEGWE